MAVFRSCLLAAAAAAVFGAPCRDGVATTSRFASTTTPGLTGDGSIPANINAFLARANDALYIRVTDFPAGPLPTLALRAWAGWNSNAAGNGGLLAARNAAISSAEATSEAGGWWEAQLANSSAVAVLSLTATADVTNATVQLLDDEREVIYTWAAPSASAGAPMYFWAAETCVDVANEFASFISRAGKRYATSEEASFRLRIFNATLDFVAKHNARGNASWSMGVNSMSDLTEEELKSRFYGLRADSNAPPSVGGRVLRAADTSSDAAAQTAARAQAAVAARRMETDAAVAAAAQAAGRAGVAPGADAAERGRNLQTTIVDWATQANVVTPARSQGSTCNSCWAFAAAGAIESAGAIAGRGLYDLSEQQLIDCTMSPVTTNMGCDGGSYVVAFQWLAAQPAGYGLCTESAYPYSTGAGQCRTCTPPFPVTGFVAMPSTSKDSDIQTALTARPLAVGIYSTTPFVYYSSGVYNDATCAGSTNANHAMLLVGMGADANKVAFWKVKNSWGSTWGESGFARIARGTGANCKLTTSAAYPIVPALPSPTAAVTPTATRTRSPGSASPTRSPASATATPTKTATPSRTASATPSRASYSSTPSRSASRGANMGMAGPVGAAPPADTTDGGADVGAIVGGVVGGVAAVALVVAGFVVSRRRAAAAAPSPLLSSPRRVPVARGGPGSGSKGSGTGGSSPTRRPVVRTLSPVAAAAGAGRGRSAARPGGGASAVSPRSASAGAGSAGVRVPRATHSLASTIGAPAAGASASASAFVGSHDDGELLAAGSSGSEGHHAVAAFDARSGARSSRKLTEDELADVQIAHAHAHSPAAGGSSGRTGRSSLVPASFGLSAYRGGKLRGVGLPSAGGASGSRAAAARAHMAPLSTAGAGGDVDTGSL